MLSPSSDVGSEHKPSTEECHLIRGKKSSRLLFSTGVYFLKRTPVCVHTGFIVLVGCGKIESLEFILSQVEFKLIYGPGYQTNVDDSMTINRILIKKRYLCFYSILTLVSMY